MATFALLAAAEFDAARTFIPALASHRSYDDWLDLQQGRMMSLALAGVDTRMAEVSLNTFIRWCVAEKVVPTDTALDAFAELSEGRDKPRSPLETPGADSERRRAV